MGGGGISAPWGLSSHATLTTPPSPDCESTKDNATAWWGKNAGGGDRISASVPRSPQALADGRANPLV